MASNSRLFFIVLSVSAAIGIGNLFAFTYLKFDFSGIFFIPYIIALLALGVPLLLLEFSTAQYFGKNVIDMFASIRKWFSSIGWLMIINSFILMCIYAAVFSWHIVYFFVSFGTQWSQSPRTYFFSNVLQISDGLKNFGKLSLPVFISLIIAWVLIFLCIRKGYEGIKKKFFAALAVFFSLGLFFLSYSLNLDNALTGIYSLIELNFSGFFDLDLWIAAFSLAIISLGVSFGVMNVFARKSDKGFVAANSFIIILFELISAIVLGFILFAILGFLSGKGITDSSLTFDNYGSLFITLTQALPFFNNPAVLSMLFFIFLSIFFILGASALGYSIAHILVHKFNAKQMHASILVCGAGFLFGLVFAIKPGFYIMDIMAHFIYYNILLALLLETVAVGWFFESDKISSFINQYSSVKLGKIWRLMIRFIVPSILIALISFQLKSDLFERYGNYPLWALIAFGAGIVAVPLIVAFLLPQRILDRR
ncbi:hypothetical protein HYX06_04895 [Candidatus Woesearchaeota archaeon]|nr:hypothetical protein [Candidatus Woesearchaeota archaeon]